MNTWLVIDVSCICYRAFHSTGDLSYKEVPTGVLYGFFRDIVYLQDRFNTDKIVFCFDKGRSFRYDLLPSYKRTRKKKYASAPKEERRARAALKDQIKLLRRKYLKYLGYKNILSKSRFEADDIIASVVKNLPTGDEAIIVSSDSDMLQLLKSNVNIYNPHQKRTVTKTTFLREFRIRPFHWVNVKAIVGCPTDDIKGVKGIGIPTAIKFLTHNLKPGAKKDSILHNPGFSQWSENIKLVKLPFPGTPVFKLQEDEVTAKKWIRLCKKLGMRSLMQNPPIPSRKLRSKHV